MTTTLAPSTPVAERALAPDLARGMMLLLIALANIPWFLYGSTVDPYGLSMHSVGGSVADRIVQGFTIVVADMRTYPMFAFLFAYGIGQLYARQVHRGTSPQDARRLLRRRHLWMILLGALHALLLWQGDIIGLYGLVGLILVPLFFVQRDGVLKAWIIVFLSIGAFWTLVVLLLGFIVPTDILPPAAPGDLYDPFWIMAEPNYILAAAARIGFWFTATPVTGLLTLAVPTAFLMGILAARHRILDEPGRHLPLLRKMAIIGIGVGLLGSVPVMLTQLDLWTSVNSWAFAVAQPYTGVFGGVGYAAMFGLIAHALAQRNQPTTVPVVALVALGRRSLSGYLAQSVVFAPLLTAWGFGLGAYLTSWSAGLLAFGTWLATVVVAYLMDRRGIRGPAEVLLRDLAYKGRQVAATDPRVAGMPGRTGTPHGDPRYGEPTAYPPPTSPSVMRPPGPGHPSPGRPGPSHPGPSHPGPSHPGPSHPGTSHPDSGFTGPGYGPPGAPKPRNPESGNPR